MVKRKALQDARRPPRLRSGVVAGSAETTPAARRPPPNRGGLLSTVLTLLLKEISQVIIE
jgi:hypothetical protein